MSVYSDIISSSIYNSSDIILPIPMTDKCVILDLDQTLIATQEDLRFLNEFNVLSNQELLSIRNRIYYLTIEDLEKPGIGSNYTFWGITRPHVREFLIFCFSYFKIVAVWSAGKKPYVEAIVDFIFKDLPYPHIIFTHDDIEIDSGGHVIKPLIKMIESNPVLKRQMTLQNNIAIDDNIMTFSRNPGSGVAIPEYNPIMNINTLLSDDPTLLQLKYWLLTPEVVNNKDISLLNKSEIFSTSIEIYKNKIKGSPGYKLK